jgi:hypothetical protein
VRDKIAQVIGLGCRYHSDMRRALSTFIILAVLALAGCSTDSGVTLEASDGTNDAAALVETPSLATFQSLAAQVEATSSRFEMVMNLDSGFGSVSMPVSGAVNGDRMAIAIDMAQISMPGLTADDQAMLDAAMLEMIVVPPFMYMNFGGLDAGMFGGDWIAIDLTQSAGADELLDGLGGMGSDPFGSMRLLEQADRFEEIGTDSVRGVETTHYRLIVNPAAAWERLDEDGRAALSASLGDFGAAPPDIDIPYDVWLDEQGRARRLAFSMNADLFEEMAGARADAAELQAMGDLAMAMTLEIYDYGDPSIVIEAPAGAVDMTELFGSLPN